MQQARARGKRRGHQTRRKRKYIDGALQVLWDCAKRDWKKIAALVAMWLLIFTAILRMWAPAQDKQAIAEPLQWEQLAETTEATEKTTEAGLPYPFNIMSHDWSGEDVAGFVYYELPEEFVENGGYMPEEMQQYTYIICNQNGVSYAMVLAMIEVESGYKWNADSGSGDVGYMQVNQK